MLFSSTQKGLLTHFLRFKRFELLYFSYFKVNFFTKLHLKTAQNFSAEQMNMQMMHRLTAVFALVDDYAVTAFQTQFLFKGGDGLQDMFYRFRHNLKLRFSYPSPLLIFFYFCCFSSVRMCNIPVFLLFKYSLRNVG